MFVKKRSLRMIGCVSVPQTIQVERSVKTLLFVLEKREGKIPSPVFSPSPWLYRVLYYDKGGKKTHTGSIE